MMDVNVYHVAMMVKKFLPMLQARRKWYGIVNVSSTIGSQPAPNCSVYSSTKAFVNFLTRSLSYELENCDVMCLAPGLTKTNMPKELAT